MTTIQTQTKWLKAKVPPPNSQKAALKDDSPRRVTPSVYTQEILQTTGERLATTSEVHPPRILELLDMSKTTHHKLSVVDMDLALFQPFPSEVVFQNFTPAQTYKLPLLLFNNDKVSRHVRLEPQDSEYFHVEGPEHSTSKVAPGMSATFTVSFNPQEKKDYHHRLVFVTERERFEVPILAVGPRAVLDFRDEIHLPLCPVKASTQRTQLVHNIGKCTARFKLHTQRPFSVTPSCGTLDVGESMQVTVNFNPVTKGDHSQDLLLHYHTGEDVYISVYGVSEELNIHLEPDSVMMNKTYISLADVRNVSLTNRSDITVKFCWSMWPTQEEEDLDLLRESSILGQIEIEEKERLLLECESDPTAAYRIPLLARALQDFRSQVAKDHLLALSHSCITVEPAEGEIYPNVTRQFSIIFKPEEAKLHQQTIYCDVTGSESRLPLKISGKAIGPELQLNYNLMDMKNIFIGDRNCYEVLVSNKGLIDAPFKLSCPNTTSGRCFSFSPEKGVLPSGASQTVRVNFQSRILGTLSEDLLLSVTGEPEPVILTFRGCVVGPTFHFDVLDLNFGDVAFGFPQTLTCTLFNTSWVPMNFALRVLGDGSGSPSVPCTTQVSELSRNNWQGSTAIAPHARPVEFTLDPAVGSVRAMSDVTIKVTLCSNTVSTYRLAMVVDVEGVGENIGTLPINARCVVPEIVVETPVLDFKRCFLNYPYEQQVQLTNPNILPVCYGVLDQKNEEAPSLLFQSSKARGVISPQASKTIPVVLLAKATGRLHHSLRIAVFGSTNAPLEVILSCIGQGPVVHVLSPQLDFGRIPVLTDITRNLQLSNQSSIPATFTACMSHRRSFWRVEPSEGEVPPESELELRVVAHLKDIIFFQDKLEVSIHDGQKHTIPLSATGIGTTIVSDRPFAPILDLGTHFSHKSCQYHFTLTNLGQRVHRMYWGMDGFMPCTKTRKKDSSSGRTVLPPIPTPKTKDVQSHGSLLVSSREKPVFTLSPCRVELFPGSSIDMVLSGSSDSTKVVRERLVCRGIVGHQGSYEQIMKVDVTCRFVAPVLSFSSKQLNFSMQKVPGKSLEPMFEKLVLKNVSSLCVSMKLSLMKPFTLCEAPGTKSSTITKCIVLGDGKQDALWVCFRPDFCQDRVSQVVDKFLEVSYQGHPQQDVLELHAEVHFPNLHFSSTTVDFGCVQNYAETHRVITITNCSKLPVSYRWAFLEDRQHHIIRDIQLQEEDAELGDSENGTEEGKGSSSLSSPASPVPLSPSPVQEQITSMSVEEVFDVLPLYGHLQPGEKQLVTFSFYGHEHISREVVAQCKVEEGPTYQIKLRGEASVISYSLNRTHIDFGLQLFDHVGEAEVTLRNTGKVVFRFLIIHPQMAKEEAKEEAPERKYRKNDEFQIRPGQPMVIPSMGYIDAGAEQCLRVLYLPGTLEFFEKLFQLQVAFLPPQVITLTGEGVFPRICLNLPRNLSQECYSNVMLQAKSAVEANGVREAADGGGASTEYEELLQKEIESALVKENVLAVTEELLELRDSEGASRKWHKLSKLLLPEYILDFGHSIPCKVLNHTVNVTNVGSVPVSFQAICKHLAGTGFSVEFERVKNLPCGETQTFTVKFDPQGAKMPMGEKCVVMPIQVAEGMVVPVRLCTVVTMPAITVSTDKIQFDTVQCGMCQMKTIQLLNHKSVPCMWSIAEDVRPCKKVEKFIPLYQRKKILEGQQPPSVVFEMIPPSGLLTPGERINVQIKFSPIKGHAYNRQLVVQVAESKQQLFINAQGLAEEPQLEFCPLVLDLGPCLPNCTEIEAEVTVNNPCSFPIEFYSIEFDKQYIEEEKILRQIQGYENDVLLLPPRVSGESLHKELHDHHNEGGSQLKDNAISETIRKVSCGRLEQLEMTPISRAIARHMGVDLSRESLAAFNRRGIAFIVYGAPLTEESNMAAALADHYGGACLSLDGVVTDVLMHGTSPVSLTARQLYDTAAAKHAEKKAGTTESRSAAHSETSHTTQASSQASQGTVEVVPKASEARCSRKEFTHPQETEKTHSAAFLEGEVPSLIRLLPDHLLVNILTERFHSSDCFRGIVIEGLRSAYTQSMACTLQVVLKALKKRKYIYVVNLSDSYTAMRARDRAHKEPEDALHRKAGEDRLDNEAQWLQDLDEEWYDALPDEQKEYITQRWREKLQRQRRRELERLAREEEGRRIQEMKKLREEELKRKGKKGGKRDAARRKSLQEGKQSADLNSQRASTCNKSPVDRKEEQDEEGHYSKESDESQSQTEETQTTETPETEHMLELEEMTGSAELKWQRDELKRHIKSGGRDHREVSMRKGPCGKESDMNELHAHFRAYEKCKVQVKHILHHWDRDQGLLLVPLPSEEPPQVSEEASCDKKVAAHPDTDKIAEKGSPRDAIPHIVLNVKGKDHANGIELLKGCTLPPVDEVLDDLGLGPSGPPIPPSTTFSIVPFPKNRKQSQNQIVNGCFTFLVPSRLGKHGNEEKDLEEDRHGSAVKEEPVVTAPKTRTKGSSKASAATKEKGKRGSESQRSKHPTSARMRSKSSARSHLSVSTTSARDEGNLVLKRSQSLTTFRWVVPANGEVLLRIWFYSDTPGKFEQAFNFELLGTQRHYQLLCRGICTYPSICKNYTTLFSLCKKVAQVEEGLQKCYVVDPGYYEFGPLLCSKTRDRFKENRYPENMERVVIHNNSSMDTEVQFNFQSDKQATTYLLEPPIMSLKPDEKQELTVWAYPTRVGPLKEAVVCCIKDNPEPVILNFSCYGVWPELELDNKLFLFNRILLPRLESSIITLRNRTALPVSWKLQGAEDLGDEFSLQQDQGIISSNTSFPLKLHFRAKRPLCVKKVLRLEVSDVDKILGVVHTENIQVSAEAYDINLGISPDGCLDFGTIRVFEESKLSLKLRNQGKYEIAYMFTLEWSDPTHPNPDTIFVVTPQFGTLLPHEKPTAVQFICKPQTELSIIEQPLLPCQVIEPSIGNGGEIIATLGIKVSVQSVFSSYKITPVCDINFGPLVCGSKKSQSFTIENSGVFETYFTISRMIIDPVPKGRPGGPSKKIQEKHPGQSSSASNKVRRESVQNTSSIQARLSLGIFSVSPCSGLLQPGSLQVVTVDCAAEQLGNWNQGLLIDISDRDPADHPEGIPYRLLAEVCKPALVVDMSSIFEEHHLCHSSRQLSSEQFCDAECIYVLDEKKFIFNKVLVRQTARARFKFTNNSKVPCPIGFSIRYVGSKSSRSLEVFELSTTALTIPSQSYSFATVTFKPQSMQQYNAVFEVTMEGASRTTPTCKTKVLEFELIGEGNLPSVCVVQPALKNKRGRPLLQFRRLIVGRRHTLPLVLLNDGNVPAQVQIDLFDKHGVLTLNPAFGKACSFIQSTQLEDTSDSENDLVTRALLTMNGNEQVEFEVSLCSDKPLIVKAKITMQVENNQYSKTIIHVTGETFQEIVSLDNIRKSSQEMDVEVDEKVKYEVLNFGECHVNCPYQESFTMTNHSSSQAVKFEWPPAATYIFFSPQIGHLHPGCSKEVTVQFSSKQPVTLNNQLMRCKVLQVEFKQPLDKVADWDDRMSTVQWLSASEQASQKQQQPVKNKVPEPCNSEVDGSKLELELRISAVCEYAKFTCSTASICIKDTVLFQTNHHQLQMENLGNIKLEFSWQVINQNDQRGETPISRPGSSSAGALTGAQPSSALSSVMSPLMGEPEPTSFSVEPSVGTIKPGSKLNFSIRFSPLENGTFKGRLLCSIPNLPDSQQAPCISVSGSSLLPLCHFDLEESEYTSGSRESLESNVRVIEINAVGLSLPVQRSFAAWNPTSEPYSYTWKCEDSFNSPFHCLTPCGTIQPGTKLEMCFEYTPEQLDVVESFWSFVIETLSLSVPFLCVANTREPLVYLNRPHLDFGDLLVGHKVEQTVELVNGEEEPFSFSILQPSLLSEDQQSCLILQPMSGKVSPKERLPFSVSFTPRQEGYVSFKLVLKVKRKTEPITLTVKADCFTMNTLVQLENPDGGLREINSNYQETVDFGKVVNSEQSTLLFLVSNLARVSMEVSLDFTGPSELLKYLVAKPENATIEVGKQLQVSLFFCPKGNSNLHNIQLRIKVKHGPTFILDIKGKGIGPSLEFSFTKFNFGKCLLHCPGKMAPSQTLVISNKGELDISVQCQFKNTSYLELQFQTDILSPGAVMKVPIIFCPREVRRYHEKLTFLLNSSVMSQVDILGQGIEMRLEVEDPRQRKIKLGSVVLGQEVKKQVVLVNRSPSDLSFTLLLTTNTQLDLKDLSFSPAGKLNLKARGGVCTTEIHFSPHQHIPALEAELQAEFPGLLHPLLTIQGSCQAVEIRLDQEHLAFGAIVQHCQARRRIIMMNTGHVGTSFNWDIKRFPQELTILPAKGYIHPGMEVPFDLTFAPEELKNDTRYENLPCFVENSLSPVTLTVTGSCIVASPSKEVVIFVCPVRGSQTQTLPLSNPANQCCRVRPVIDGEQWSAAPEVTLEAFESKPFEITYRPLTTTADGKKHLGSVFFSFPDGTGLLYSLRGTAEPPKPEDTVVCEIPAKTQHTEMLPVKNWLSKKQRFRVLFEILKPDKPDVAISLKGLEYIDVPALAKRVYKMSFFTYKEGQYTVKVTFQNEVTEEYIFYLVIFKVSSPEVLSTIELATTVRRTISAIVQVENPLTTAICLTTECKCPDISIPPQHTVPGQSKGSLSFKYQPLCAGESTVGLTLCSSDLGSFHYNLLLRALPPPPEKTIVLNTTLGSSHSVPVNFTNHSRCKTDYLCKTDCPDFTVDKIVSASPGFLAGCEVSVELCFEPHLLGEVRGQLSLSSTIGGEFIFPLHGHCLPPKPQGPFRIRTGRNVTIPFKNVFLETTAFSFQVDNPSFTVKAVDTILSKKTQNLTVTFDAPTDGSVGPWSGKLIITGQPIEGKTKPQWVYYLEGFCPDFSSYRET